MTDKEKAQEIVNKYGKDYSRLSNEATAKEMKIFLKYLADEANRKQRKLVGLES